jgi:hypothetical protein
MPVLGRRHFPSLFFAVFRAAQATRAILLVGVVHIRLKVLLWYILQLN